MTGSISLSSERVALFVGVQDLSKVVSVNGKEYAFTDAQLVSSGAMGKVYFAQASDANEVCVKEAKEEGYQDIENEAASLSSLAGHPAFVSMLSYDEGKHLLVLEKCDGKLMTQRC